MPRACVYIKLSALLIISGILLGLAGCATTSTHINGNEIDDAVVNDIKSGETTAGDIAEMFGEPTSKKELSENEEEWTYHYTHWTEKKRIYIITTNVKRSGHQKTLKIVFRDEVVMDYVFRNEPLAFCGVEK